MIELTKEQVQSRIVAISTMQFKELEATAIKISMSEIDKKARGFLNRAIDIRLDELLRQVSPLCEGSEVLEGDLE